MQDALKKQLVGIRRKGDHYTISPFLNVLKVGITWAAIGSRIISIVQATTSMPWQKPKVFSLQGLLI